MRTLLDANCILRYLLDDIPEQAEQVRLAVLSGAQTKPFILAEAVCVLSGKVYGIPRPVVRDALSAFLDDVECDDVVTCRRALDIFAETRLDFADCLLAAMHDIEGAEILTFDKNLKKHL